MVICLIKVRRVFIVVSIFILFIGFIYLVGYISSYFRFDDRDYVLGNVLIEQNRILKKELDDISNLDINGSDYVIGKVLYRDIYSFYNEVVINVGNDKVSSGDAVINSEGLVGVISKVDKNKSYVKLLSSDYNISVVVNDTYGNLSNGVITLLDKYSDIEVGDIVYTSGLSGIQKGIYIGIVEEVSYDEENLGKKVKVKLVDNKYLNYIGVIKSIK